MDDVTAEFVAQAKRVRDYGIRAGTLPNETLIDALLPFDIDPDENDPAKIADLRRAALASFAAIDPITLDRVLHGEDPTYRPAAGSPPPRAPFWRRAFRSDNLIILAGIGIILLAFHYTHWTQKAEAVLSAARELGETDYQAEMRQMVETGLLIEAPGEISPAGSTVMPDIFNTEVATFVGSAEMLQFYQVSQQQFFAQATGLLRENNPVLALFDVVNRAALHAAGAFRRPVPVPPPPTPPPDSADAVMAAKAVTNDEVAETQPVALQHYQGYLMNVERISDALGINNMGASNFAAMRATQLNYQNQIVIRAEMTNRWILPMIYGALGSIVYSVVRYLNQFLSNPPLRTSLLRVLFGAFTGITISMLFGPSTLFDFGVPSIAPSLLLICFLFGYSIDSFLALLRRADAYISAAFGPAKAKA